MEMPEFEKLIRRALGGIPASFRKILKKEGIRLLARESVPSALRDRREGGTVFGVFVGVSYDKRSVFDPGGESTRIELYKDSFEKSFRSRREMEEQIVRTVVHEIGHYFGFSEKRLRELGY